MRKRFLGLMSLCSALLVLLCGAQICFASHPAVQFLGVPTSVFTSGISFPTSVAEDTSGNVYIAEYNGNAVYKETLQPDGTYVRSTVASGFNYGPVGLTVDSAGNVYIGLDLTGGTSRLLKETLQGDGSYVQSYIGILSNDVYGVAVDGSGNVFATSNYGTNTVTKFIPSGGSYNSSVIYTSSTGMLAGLALDTSGNLFVAQEYGRSIYKLTPTGTPATTTTYTPSTITVGAGTSAFGVAVDVSGDLFIADSSGYGKIRLEVPDGSGGYTETVLASGLSYSYGITVGPSGTIYFGVYGAVDKFAPAAVNLGSPNLNVASVFTLNYMVQSGTVIGAINVVSQGAVNTQSGSPEFINAGGGTCTAQTYSSLTVCSVKVSFTPRFTGLQTGAVQIFDAGGNILNNVYLYGVGKAPQAGFSAGTAGLLSVTGLESTPLSGARHPVMDVAGNLYIADSGNNRIVKVAPGGAATVLSTPSFTLDRPTAVAIDGAGNLYIADSGNGRVVELSAQGVAIALDTNSLALAANYGVAVDGQGNVYTSDATNNRVLEFPSIGSAHVLSTTGVTLGSAYGVAADGNGNVYIADRSNSRIVVVSGGTGTVLNTGTLSPALADPTDVAVDAVGNLYIADSGNSRIVEVSSGSSSAIALGTGSYTLNAPDCAVAGNVEDLYICDSGNNRIVTSNQKAPATLTFSAPGTTQSTTLMNLGNLPLTLSVPASGNNPGFGTASFTLMNAGDTGYCPQLSTTSSAANIVAGANCTLSVEFAPAGGATGTIADSLTITDNDLNTASSAQVILLSGAAPSTPTVTLTPSPTSPITYGQAQTSLNVAVTYTPGTPTGTVSFTDNSTSLGSATTLNAGTATFAAQYYLAGAHSFQANYSGDSNFNAASSTTASYIVNKASSTVSGPTGTMHVAHGSSGSITATVTGQYSGAGILAPSGSVSYSIADSHSNVVASGSAAIDSGSATVPVASTLATGLYTVTLGYVGDANYNAATANTVNLQDGTITPTINWSQPSGITYGNNLSGLLNATATNAAATVAGSFTYTATPVGGSAATVTSVSVLNAGTYQLTATFTPSDPSTYGSNSTTVGLIVDKAKANIQLISSTNPVLLANSTTLSVTVSSTASTPTGSVTFLDGTTPLSTVTLSGGVATLMESSLPIGAHSISAIYSGDANFSTASSSTLTQLVIDFAIVSSGGNGSSGSAPTQTVLPGGAANYSLAIVPSAGTTFSTPTVFNLTGMPAGATATVTPSTWVRTTSTSWTYPANTALQNIALTIQLPATTARNQTRPNHFAPVLWGLLLFPFAAGLRRASRRLHLLSLLLIVAVGCIGILGVSGCGSSNGFFSQQSKSYTITETVTSGNLSHSTTITLTVE